MKVKAQKLNKATGKWEDIMLSVGKPIGNATKEYNKEIQRLHPKHKKKKK